jgi:hypothetical protein
MASLTLLDVDQLPIGDRDTLAYILAAYGVTMIAVYPDGAMHCLVENGLEEALLATIARDVAPVAA